MPDIDQEVGRVARGEIPRSQIRGGWIAQTADEVEDDLEVVVPSFDETYRHGPCKWPTRVDDDGGLVYPTREDPCLVAFDEEGEPQIILWWKE